MSDESKPLDRDATAARFRAMETAALARGDALHSEHLRVYAETYEQIHGAEMVKRLAAVTLAECEAHASAWAQMEKR